MTGLREATADHVDELLLFGGIALFVVGGSVGVPVLQGVGAVLFFAAIFVSDFLAEVLSADGAAADGPSDPLDELRERYASGELDHEEFERRVERLLATEDRPEDVEQVLDAERE